MSINCYYIDKCEPNTKLYLPVWLGKNGGRKSRDTLPFKKSIVFKHHNLASWEQTVPIVLYAKIVKKWNNFILTLRRMYEELDQSLNGVQNYRMDIFNFTENPNSTFRSWTSVNYCNICIYNKSIWDILILTFFLIREYA